MIQIIVLMWIACRLNAPWWINVLIGVWGVSAIYSKFYVEKQINKAVGLLEEELRR